MLRWLFFNLAYFRKPVWDTGISPPELLEFIAVHTPGKALELGCGTGTNAIALAKAGWQVTGVDFARRALNQARIKAQKNGVRVDFHRDNVTSLAAIHGPFDLILDIGCFHALPFKAHQKYMANIERLLAPSGTFLLYVFFRNQAEILGPGVYEEAVAVLSEKFMLIHRENGSDRGIRSSAWLTIKKKPEALAK